MAEERAVLFRADWLSASIGGRLVGNPDAAVSAVEVDSRAVRPGALFAALPGERADGHDYIRQALASGASVILAAVEGWKVRAEVLDPALARAGAAAVLVRDSLEGLQGAARAWRLKVPSLVRVGITGSSGKTTTKECLGRILARKYRTVVNPGNLNSEIGLPQAMFLLRPEHEVGVFEMGINHSGEMDALVRVWEPSHALITNIGTAHIGILGSREAIAREKKKIFSALSASGSAFAWEDDEFLPFLAEGLPVRLRTFGPRTLEGLEGFRDAGLDGWALRYRGVDIAFPLPGTHNLLDALAAAALAADLGCGPDAVKEGLEGVTALFGRSEIFRGPVTVLRDCYNSNPDSAARALEFCDSLTWPGRRIYALGSMLELGTESAAEHRELGRRAGRSRADALLFFGAETFEAARAAREAGFSGPVVQTEAFDELARAAEGLAREGDLWLLKASRGMELERLTDILRGR